MRYNTGMKKRRKKPRWISDQLRRAIEDHPVSRYRISKDTGIDATVLSKFVRGERGVSLDTFDVLCEYLGLELRPRGKGK